MPTFIAFLRAVNVGGHNRMTMDDLRGAIGDAGFENGRTYIQSGNVVLDADESDPDAVADRITHAIADAFGYDIDVFVRTRKALAATIDDQPFDTPPADGVRLYVTFLADDPTDDRVQALHDASSNAEAFEVRGRDVYSRLDRNELADGEYTDTTKALGVTATRRAWNVVTSVHDLAS